MQVTSIRIPAETLHEIEWLKIYLQEIAPIKYTTTDVIKIAIDRMYKTESNKLDST